MRQEHELSECSPTTPDGSAKMDSMPRDLTADERSLLRTALLRWGGPARPIDDLAVALGFGDVADFYAERHRLAEVLMSGGELSPVDATRALAAAEVVSQRTSLAKGSSGRS
jgi:hypothetical protein